ncbi:helix-turn-helix domain-containing protein [Burkholderia contaminans]|uniref:helix-turn-helix domain-containing protein n=1 Tax=Burkholderia contaminans TaxID=488447 RepID=UPI0015821888|nr:LysR family transcriptional regulator [Burkholderia contaminans]
MTAPTRPTQFNWNLLKAFAEIARHHSMTEAAQVIGVQRQTVSQKITELEQILGQSLMERRPGSDGFRLTAYGRRLRMIVTRFDRDLAALREQPENSPAAFDAVDILGDVETAMAALKRAADSLRQS